MCILKPCVLDARLKYNATGGPEKRPDPIITSFQDYPSLLPPGTVICRMLLEISGHWPRLGNTLVIGVVKVAYFVVIILIVKEILNSFFYLNFTLGKLFLAS